MNYAQIDEIHETLFFVHFCVDGNLAYSDFTWNGEASKERGIEASVTVTKNSWLKNVWAVVFRVLCVCICVPPGKPYCAVFALTRGDFAKGDA